MSEFFLLVALILENLPILIEIYDNLSFIELSLWKEIYPLPRQNKGGGGGGGLGLWLTS